MTEYISLGGLIVAFSSFAFAQWRANMQNNDKEERIEFRK